MADAGAESEERYPWWQVMCLTGLDYFSTLGYQPGIALLAAGWLSPLATLALVLFTLFGALPLYRRVAEESPHGEGSLGILARLIPGWRGKVLVLVVLGFMATDYTLTITLSAADAAVHLLQNPLVPPRFQGHQVALTLFLIAVLGFIFYLGFREAIGVAVAVTTSYLALNAVVLLAALARVDQGELSGYLRTLSQQYPEPAPLLLAVVLAFPQLALGLSGFETGVAVMPLVRGLPDDDPERPRGRIRNTQRLLTAAASLMGFFLLASSLATTLLIPPGLWTSEEVSGRAISYLAHRYLGEGVGSLYDLASILILWFAGASAMAGLLTLVPRYLPRFGMAPEWARRRRPLVLFFTAVAFAVTLAFRARVEAQAAAYATGVLVVMASAALALYLLERRARSGRARYFGGLGLVFAYVLAANVLERPDGVRIAAFFIATTLLASFVSRGLRALELRVERFLPDEEAERLIARLREGEAPVRLVAHRPEPPSLGAYMEKERRIRRLAHLPPGDPVYFVEVYVPDPSEFSAEARVWGVDHPQYKVFRILGSSAPNALAAFLLYLRDRTGKRPHIYFEWPEESPWHAALDFLLFGEGDVPALTREILRRAEPDPERRPLVHVGG
ncbi:amino acid transporter (plasmid) [Thermus thermophilus]|uniref:Amino acid transporter n=1 Tax=Thermus thermophilus TaxID=274 RepID=A0AAD1KXN3_THETH|nr:amino acid transporter [Thermus thermophilus]BBL83332.1 amino acid transporter [Thermus thermophilus]BBL85605.1 amino acid transporter [Thermus thermophilus]BCZ88050.1 amino acid transporter [Thermus thermophilus]BCZ90334.1 amino acid transporter [Thermus thermophilus]BCZ93036.1 amino acid transporter [Thermus thermophilus]